MARARRVDTRPWSRRITHFFGTPKGVLLIVLVGLLLIAAGARGIGAVMPIVVASVVSAAILDAAILRVRKQRWVLPDGALLTGLLVAMILAAEEPWYVGAITAAAAVASKYLIRLGKANVFNPAALGLVIAFYLFGAAESWWGALPDLPLGAVLILLAVGVYTTWRVQKAAAVLSFLGAWYLVVTVAAFAGNPASVAELFRAPDLHAALFFAFFMVSDPPTSPPRHRDQVVFGVIAAVVSYAVFALVGAAYFLLAGVLIANIHEAWRRRSQQGIKGRMIIRPQPGE